MPHAIVKHAARAALHHTARIYRSLALKRTAFIVVTGSCGKTTTKELIAGVLGTRMQGFRSPHNNNTPWHIPRLVLRNRPSHEFSVIELGAAGETLLPIDEPLQVLQPTIAVVTNIGTDHFTVFRDLDATAAHKGKLVESLGPDGVAVLNADDPRVLGMRSRCRGRVVTYGFGGGATVTGSNVACEWPDRLLLDVTIDGRTVPVRTQLCAKHLAPDVLAAIAVGHVMGVPLDVAAAGASRVEPFPGRMSPLTTPDGITFMSDDQKAPMWTMPATLEFLRTARAARKIVVLGTVSDFPGNPGRKIPRVAADLLDHADVLIAVGNQSTYALRARPRVGGRLRRAVSNAAEALACLQEIAEPGDLVLVKGSESDQLDRIARDWRPRQGGAVAPAGPRPRREPAPPDAEAATRLLVVGLGNPEPRYANTPHNIGQAAVDGLAGRLGARWSAHGSAQVATATWKGVPLVLVKPGTWVNDTGPELRRLAEHFGVDARHCVVVLDDLHIDPGAVRRRDNGSSGGHNGMQSIIVAFQTENIRRVKIGVGRPDDGDVPAYVLRPFDGERRTLMAAAADRAVDTILQMAAGLAPRPPKAKALQTS